MEYDIVFWSSFLKNNFETKIIKISSVKGTNNILIPVKWNRDVVHMSSHGHLEIEAKPSSNHTLQGYIEWLIILNNLCRRIKGKDGHGWNNLIIDKFNQG